MIQSLHPVRGFALATLGSIVVALPSWSGADEAAQQLVDEMIVAHGGMANWKAAETAYFEDQWTYQGGQKGPLSKITVDQRTRRAYHDYTEMDATVVWDGEKAWSTNWAMPMPPRFLATLNYYFLNLPWLAKDPGVRLATEAPRRLPDDATEYLTVRVTYEAGVGDTPDDYYVLYIDPVRKMLKACEYIVTYQAILPEGVEHSPPHVLIYETFATVNGLLVPTAFTIYEEGEFYAGCEIANWSFDGVFDEGRMIRPEGAVVDTSQP
ncbi:MAG: hypothetical protein DHS20C21_11550 [Gemmatimonadota bacterium]|nr:MAG: hypothetical protein DHS20C21_11550 [Gemmatimonadota bacterium]